MGRAALQRAGDGAVEFIGAMTVEQACQGSRDRRDVVVARACGGEEVLCTGDGADQPVPGPHGPSVPLAGDERLDMFGIVDLPLAVP